MTETTIESPFDSVLASREAFNSYVYLDWKDAVAELDRRQADPKLAAYIAEQLPHGVPAIMEGKKSIALFRHIATPNYEISRFAACADTLTDYQPLILEYTADKFNDRNEWKRYLGKLRFSKGLNKQNQPIVEHIVVINFNESNNKPMNTLHTHWGESFVDFHHDLFGKRFPQLMSGVYDLSDWLSAVGPMARDYYKAFFILFLKHGILFENFLIDGKEQSFTREIILPALQQIENETGYKPLIVALEPTEEEESLFWLSHPHHLKEVVERRQVGITPETPSATASI